MKTMSEILIPPKSPGYQLSTIHYRLNFRLPSATSRGVYTVRDVWYVTVLSGNRWGVGECAPLKGLSCDDMPDYANILTSVCRQTENNGYVNIEALRLYPSILFGLETAFRHLETGSFRLWDTPFSRGETGIHINGLVWMAGYDVMLKQVEEKLTAGFRCIKLKVGAIGFEHELDILAHIRKHFNASEVELRLDANGAFTPDQVMEKLNRLSDYDIHSIEQPIRAGQRDYMAQLAELSPIPIALDEELIGCNTPEDKYKLINHIRPQYIVLKPSLHGGMSGCAEWIKEAKAGGTGYWITSALESNIGLNAIAQWCATLDTSMPQGLGTGALFTNNIGLPLHISYTGNADCRPALCWKETQPSLLENGYAGQVTTSGSTGAAHSFPLKVEQALQSARMTKLALGLRKGDKALLCMPIQYIGARMMIVRTMTAGLDLMVSPPSGHPLRDIDGDLRFVAMLPLQVFNCLQIPVEKERLKSIGILIIGGGAIDQALEDELRNFPNAIYSTYGMTETLSHIALRRLNGDKASPYYHPLPSVKLTLSDENTLIIDAPLICDKQVVTNDVAELRTDGSFRILGRRDNIINSGGIKVQAEALEEKLRPLIPVAFAVTSKPDTRLGEAIVMLIEKSERSTNHIHHIISSTLPPYERPKHIIEVTTIPIAGNGKINRAACRQLAGE